MHESLKQFSVEIADKFLSSLSENKFAEFAEKTKAASESDTGTFEVIVSTNNQDRQGDVVDQSGWDLSHYKNNPVVLWAHDYCSLPIGVCDSIENVNGQLVAKGRFAPVEANPFAQQVRKLYDLKIVRATSVGFIAREMQGNMITKSELLEFSFVPVPANPYALSTAKAQEMSIDLEMIKAKGLEIKMDEETVQDTQVTEQNEEKKEGEKVEVQENVQLEKPEEKENVEMKSGRVISEKNRSMIQTAIESLKQTTAALEELMTASQQGDGEMKNEKSPNKKSSDTEFDEKSFNDFMLSRQVLRQVSTTVSDALTLFNKRARDYKKNV